MVPITGLVAIGRTGRSPNASYFLMSGETEKFNHALSSDFNTGAGFDDMYRMNDDGFNNRFESGFDNRGISDGFDNDGFFVGGAAGKRTFKLANQHDKT